MMPKPATTLFDRDLDDRVNGAKADDLHAHNVTVLLAGDHAD